MGYLGFWVTRDGFKPTNTKIQSITNMKPTTPRKQVQRFIGVVTYYHNMWPRYSHTLATLTKIMPNKRNFKWNKIEQYALDEIKRIMARNILLTYPDFNKALKIHANDRNFQL